MVASALLAVTLIRGDSRKVKPAAESS